MNLNRTSQSLFRKSSFALLQEAADLEAEAREHYAEAAKWCENRLYVEKWMQCQMQAWDCEAEARRCREIVAYRKQEREVKRSYIYKCLEAQALTRDFAAQLPPWQEQVAMQEGNNV